MHHAGNSSGIVDGAALMLIGSKKMGRKLGLKPRARIRQTAVIGSEPTIMLTGPEFAAAKVLKRAGMDKKDIDFQESLDNANTAMHSLEIPYNIQDDIREYLMSVNEYKTQQNEM